MVADEELRNKLADVIAEQDRTARMLGVVGVLRLAVADLGLRPVVVGGLAVEYWSQGAHVTADIDLLLDHHPDLDKRLSALGFERHGRHWALPAADVFIEAPGSHPRAAERTVVVDGPAGQVEVLAPEDVLIYRLHEFHATGARDAAIQAVWLLDGVPELDRRRLEKRASEENLTDVLAAIDALATRVAAGEEIGSDELHDLSRQLGSGGRPDG